MKKLIAVVAILSFAVGLNAATSKENIYQTNPKGFDKVKVELQALNKAQEAQVKKAFQKKQINEAIKTLLTNKAVLNNANYAVIKNGKIVKSSKANEEDGISFWHEHSAGVQDAPAPYTCHIYDPSWDAITYNTTCGVLKYQMSPDSVYAGNNSIEARIVLVRDVQANIDDIEAISSEDITYAPQDEVEYIQFPMDHDDGQTQLFRNFQEVADIIPFAGYVATSPTLRFYKPIGESSYDFNTTFFDTYYEDTEYTQNGNPIKRLKDGSYIELLTIYYNAGADWWDGYNVILKWFRVNVENFYDIGVENHNQNDLVKISFNNQQVLINLDESLNPLKTTYELYDMSGRLLNKKVLSSSNERISVQDVASGAYIVRVKGAKFDVSNKIIVAK